MQTKTLINYIVEKIDPEEYYGEVFEEIHWGPSDEARVHSPFVHERTPSLSVNRVTGAWYSFCESDQRGGSNLVTFHAALHEKTALESARELFDEWVHPVIDERLVRKWHRTLLETPTVLGWVLKRRISVEVLKSCKIGWDGTRITFPVYNEFGICINARRYDPAHKKGSKIPKVTHYKSKEDERSFGNPPVIYPLSVLMEKENGQIVICEGEWDTLALLTIGIPAVTSSSGAKSWPREYNYLFTGRDVIIAYDNDTTGETERKRPAQNLSNIAKSIRLFDIPKKDGKDTNDFIISRNITKATQMEKNFEKLEVVSRNEQTEILDADQVLQEKSLDKASRGELFGKIVAVHALITGKQYQSFLVPTKYRVICNHSCEGCKMASAHLGFVEKTVNPADPSVLSLIEVPKAVRNKALLMRAGIEKVSNCKAQIEEVSSVNIEKLQLIPTLDSESVDYTRQMAYYVGHGIRPNRAYKFTGTLCPHPKSQAATFLFDRAVPIQDQIETFNMTPEIRKQLAIFKAKPGRVEDKINQIAQWESTHITHIFDRPDLHIAVDLVFCSPLSFNFNNEHIHKAGLDILVVGDTRTGKGFVTERLAKYYRAGDVASGESCTQRGLIGACQKVDGEWLITWGMFPLNHKRLVVIDELSSLQTQEISELTRVRSEGVAEIVKVVRESTQANVRLISLSNPRSGRPIKSYNTGPECVKELIGANEDISRFDFILAVASDEVESKRINTVRTRQEEDFSKYPQSACRNLIFWVWSRKQEQIRFTDAATRKIINASNRFGKMYSSTIPIIQSENVRFKLAKISAAVAGRVFSCDETGEILIIDEEHVLFAIKFIVDMYRKPSFAYDVYSDMTTAATTITDKTAIWEVFKALGDNCDVTMRGLLELQRITAENLADYAGDAVTAKIVIGDLVKLRCLQRIEGIRSYIKNTQFTSLLREMQCQAKKNK